MKKLKLNKIIILLLFIITGYFISCSKEKTERNTYIFIYNELPNINIKIAFFKNGKELLKYNIPPEGYAKENYPGKWNFDFFYSQADSVKVTYNDSISVIHHKNDTITSILDPCNWLKVKTYSRDNKITYIGYHYEFIFNHNNYKEALSVQ